MPGKSEGVPGRQTAGSIQGQMHKRIGFKFRKIRDATQNFTDLLDLVQRDLM